MSLWKGNLRNSPRDIVIDSILLLLIILAHFLQFYRLLNVGSSSGISPYFLLFNALYSNIQLANTLLLTARAWPTEKSPVLDLLGSGELRGARALGAVLRIARVALLWAFSVVLLLASPPSIVAIAFIHAALFLFPAGAIALPKPSPTSLDTDLFIGFSFIFNTWISLILVALQFYPQVLEFRQMSGSPGSLSLPSLEIRAVVTIAVALRWFWRFGAPNWGNDHVPLMMWYQWGWLPFN